MYMYINIYINYAIFYFSIRVFPCVKYLNLSTSVMFYSELSITCMSIPLAYSCEEKTNK